MDTKLCRICGKLSENYVHIFKTEGLKNKIETCLPIIVSPHCLLPDTICSECLENVDNFYSFIKNCLQNIIVLEAQYDIMESCLKTKRKHEKGCLADPLRLDKNTQTEEDGSCSRLLAAQFEKLNVALSNAEGILKGRDPGRAKEPFALVGYEAESEEESEGEDKKGRVLLMPKAQRSRPKALGARPEKNYFDDAENDLISEIVQRKNLKRKSEAILPHRTKIFKIDSSSRRKSKLPKKVEYFDPPPDAAPPNLTFDNLEKIYELEKNTLSAFRPVEELPPPPPEPKLEKEVSALPQLCLLCDAQFSGPTMLAAHVYETHGIDMAQVLAQEPVMERKKKLPNLVKITDLKTKAEAQDAPKDYFEEPPTLQPTYVCPMCPAVLTNRSDLFAHLKAKHSKQASLMCGLCLHMASSYASLNDHVDSCKVHHSVASRYICKVCSYHDDNSKAMENHVVVHDFVLNFCKKQAKMFDPCDYVEVNANCDVSVKPLSCSECSQGGFATFKEFSTHRRSQHQIFHCDLCNKFYGRNSHLWKHVNRLHKGHPSITCQLCYKTSASKYHLAQHFNKIHSAKPFKQKQLDEDCVESFMSQKFQGFDFQSVRQSFMRQELLEQEKKGVAASDDANSDTEEMENDAKDTKEIKSESAVVEIDTDTEVEANDPDDYEPSKPELRKEATFPKEIDASSDLYTNIITNYTPPQNEGEYKCPKCFKAFHKKTLLKKHRKNCRPRLQKDLLTRCKTCSRIFKDRQSLTKHLINYHSEYACEICGQKVQSKCEIVSHIRFSHPKCPLFCHCGNILRSKADLLEHKKDHRNSFVCQFCADMLPTKIKLKMHILSLHRKILSLSCGICLKLFETQHILRDHVRLVHKDELSPLTSCTVCGKNYGSKWKTYDHLNKSHGRIFKACKACLDVFDTEEELQVHFETIHINVSQGGNSRPPTGPNPPASLSINANQAYESDLGEDNAKHSSSDFSNDVEVFDCVKTDAFEMVKNELNLSEDDDISDVKDMPDTAAQESRISLLEKRLLGNRKSMESDSVQDKGKQKITNVALLKKAKAELCETTPKPKETPKEKKPPRPDAFTAPRRDLDLDDAANAANPLQNSSKRTVYVNSNDPSLCEICLKTWPAKKHLWQHYIRCHKTVAATVCGICLKTNDSYETLQAHLRETHPTLLHGQGFGSNFICRICGRYHNASSKLKLHMAIHENFNWAILDNFAESNPDKAGEAANNGYVEEEEVSYMNSQWPRPAHNHGNEGINYESLIEQVECSSDSDNNSDDEPKYHIANSSSDDESDNDSVVSVSEENSLESQMLQNMLNEKYVARKPNAPEKVNSNHYEKDYSSSDSEDTSDSNQSMSDTEVEIVEDTVHEVKSSSEDEDSSQLSSEECPKVKPEPRTDGEVESSNIFLRKPEELDSAIRSISYEQVTHVDEQVDDVICDSLNQAHSLNQREIQSAVDSIL